MEADTINSPENRRLILQLLTSSLARQIKSFLVSNVRAASYSA